MNRLVELLGMTLGGWAGWALGDAVSLPAAFVVGMVGTGLGLFWTRRFTMEWLP